jgi:hypothetical protein
MSSGAFDRSKYEDDLGNIWGIRVQPETQTLVLGGVTNTEPAGATTPRFPSATVSGNRRKVGVNARLCRIQFTTTTPSGYLATGTISLPVLTLAAKAAFVKDAVGTYTLGGTAYDVVCVGVTPETIN